MNCDVGNRVTKFKPRKLCRHCFSIISKGNSHKCNDSTRFSNINTILDSSSIRKKDQILSSQLKKKAKQTKNGSIALSQRSGKPMKLSMNAANATNVEQSMMSVDDVMKIQASYRLTQNQTLGIASMLRQSTKNRKVIEPNLKEKLSARIHTLDDFFALKYFHFKNIKANKTTDAPRFTVYCKNLSGFINYVIEKREVSRFHLKFGMDGGGGSLKVSLSIQSIDDDNGDSAMDQSKRQTYEDGVASKRFRDSGVKKLFIIGLAESTQENYENVSQLWSEIDINKCNGTISTDLKLANIAAGLMPHSSLFPCTFCIANKNELTARSAVFNVQLYKVSSNLT